MGTIVTCDLCQKTIPAVRRTTDGLLNYDFASSSLDYRLNVTIHPKVAGFGDVCRECVLKMFAEKLANRDFR